MKFCSFTFSISLSILMSSTAHKEEEKYPGLAATGNLSLLDIEDDDELSTDTNLQHYTSPEEKLGNSTTNKSDIWYTQNILINFVTLEYNTTLFLFVLKVFYCYEFPFLNLSCIKMKYIPSNIKKNETKRLRLKRAKSADSVESG